MSLGKFVVDAWIAAKPIKRLRERRRRKRRLKELGITEESAMEINLGTRTSTNTLVGGGIITAVYVKAIELLPYPELVSALTTPEAIGLAATIMAWAVARVSKTPAKPGRI